MKRVGKLSMLLAISAVSAVVTAGGALAQVPLDPMVEPAENNGGWVFGMAWLLTFLGLAVVVFIVLMYLRFAPRFATDEEAIKVVRADRVVPGQELPRRSVDVSKAAPVVVAPPAIPSAEPPAPPPPAPAADAPAAAPAVPAAAEAPAAPAAEAPAAEAPAADAPAAEAPVTPPAPAPAAQDHADVSLDEEVFEAKLQELLDAGTDRRIAEGKARRAAMIAARKKAAGEA